MSSQNFINQKLLIISYNEGKQEFIDTDLVEIENKITQSSPNYIIICTQQSKIYAIKGREQHMSYLLGKSLKKKNIFKYTEIYKKNSSLIGSTIIEYSCLRISIYQKINKDLMITNKLRSNIIGQTAILTTNNQAMYLECSINKKKIIILNTELLALDSINFGESRRELEFLSLIKEFELHKKYQEGYNIIMCGSLNFRLQNMYKIINNSFRLDLYNTFKLSINDNMKKADKQNAVQKNTNKKIIEKNQLKIYLEQLMKELKNNKLELSSSVPKNIFTKLFTINTMYLNLFNQFSKSIETIGFHQNCGFSKGNNTRGSTIINTMKNAMSTSSSSTLGLFTGLIKGALTVSLQKAILPIKTQETVDKEQIIKMKKAFKLPAMCDKIIFALQEENDNRLLYIDKSFVVLDQPTKSNRRIICMEFNI